MAWNRTISPETTPEVNPNSRYYPRLRGVQCPVARPWTIYYGFAVVKPVEKSPADEQSLKEILHGKIDQMDYARLSKLSHILDQWRLEELGQTLDDAFDQDREQGKLTEEKVSKAISEHRARHPYVS